MAMPATGRLSGTPASIIARLPPQTVAIDDEPLLSVMSERTRIVYGNSSIARQHRVKRAPGELAVAGLATRRSAEAADFADRIGREVIVQHEARVGEALQPVDHLLGVLGAERRGDDRLGLAAGEQRRAVGARKEADDGLDRANRLGVAAVDAAAFLEDRAADDVGLEPLDRLRRGHLLLRIGLGERLLGLVAAALSAAERSRLVGQLVGRLDVRADEVLELGLDRCLASLGRAPTGPWRPFRPG